MLLKSLQYVGDIPATAFKGGSRTLGCLQCLRQCISTSLLSAETDRRDQLKNVFKDILVAICAQHSARELLFKRVLQSQQ